jgi:acylphosphatase
MADVPDTAGNSSNTAASFGCCRFRVRGVVQGVYFRASTQTMARDLGISGYAKNCRDGTVEVLACGTEDAIAELNAWLQHGPPMADVTAVESEPLAFQELDSFTIG